jgi:hypothetical protein
LSPAGRWNIFPAALLCGEQTRAALTVLIPSQCEFFLLLCLGISIFFMQSFSVEEAMKDGNRRRPP